MALTLADDALHVVLPLKKFLTIELCPPEWRALDLYVFRDDAVTFYVGQSFCAFERVWNHLYGGYKGRSGVGRFVLVNWPVSMRFTIELLSSKARQFEGVQHDLNAAELALITQAAPCFNAVLNRTPTPLPECYRPPSAPIRCSRNLNHLIRDAGYVLQAEVKKAWLEKDDAQD